jgi:hypothetical protein
LLCAYPSTSILCTPKNSKYSRGTGWQSKESFLLCLSGKRHKTEVCPHKSCGCSCIRFSLLQQLTAHHHLHRQDECSDSSTFQDQQQNTITQPSTNSPPEHPLALHQQHSTCTPSSFALSSTPHSTFHLQQSIYSTPPVLNQYSNSTQPVIHQ